MKLGDVRRTDDHFQQFSESNGQSYRQMSRNQECDMRTYVLRDAIGSTLPEENE
jgi:hypothetical protein